MSQPPRHRRLDVEDIGDDITVVNFVDSRILDEQKIIDIKTQLMLLVELGRRKILLNFGNIEYLSSAALGPLITLHKSLDVAGGKLVICNMDPELLETFEMTRLDKFFTICNIEMDAIAKLQSHNISQKPVTP